MLSLALIHDDKSEACSITHLCVYYDVGRVLLCGSDPHRKIF